jgi:hypothetical protein
MRKIILAGKRSSAIATFISVTYALLQILSALQLIPYPGNLYWFFLPSLLLAPAFLVMTVCLDILVNENARQWTMAAWGFATINCMMMIMVYCYQPGHLDPSEFNWKTGDVGLFIFEHHSTLLAIKYVGFFLISAGTFILAFAFRNSGSKWFFRSLLINGLQLPLLVISYLFPHYYYLASVGMVTFPLATFHATRFFTRKEIKLEKREKRKAQLVDWGFNKMNIR